LALPLLPIHHAPSDAYTFPILYRSLPPLPFFFFFNDTATTEIYTLSLHDALPISLYSSHLAYDSKRDLFFAVAVFNKGEVQVALDRKSTRLNSSHVAISYAVFCLKKKKR